MNIDWDTLTQAQARRLIGAASRAEQSLAAKLNASKTDAEADAIEPEWLKAFQLWEDLRVYALCGEKPQS